MRVKLRKRGFYMGISNNDKTDFNPSQFSTRALLMNAGMIASLYWACADEGKRSPFLTLQDICFLTEQMQISYCARTAKTNANPIYIYPIMYDIGYRTYQTKTGINFGWSMDSRIYPPREDLPRSKRKTYDEDNKRVYSQVSELLFASLGMKDAQWCEKLQALDHKKYENLDYKDKMDIDPKIPLNAELRDYLMKSGRTFHDEKGYTNEEAFETIDIRKSNDKYINLDSAKTFDPPARKTLYFYGKNVDDADHWIDPKKKEEIKRGFLEFCKDSVVLANDLAVKQLPVANIPAGLYDYTDSLRNGEYKEQDFVADMTYAAEKFAERGFADANRKAWANENLKETISKKHKFIRSFTEMGRDMTRIVSAQNLGERLYFEDGSTMQEKFEEIISARSKMQRDYLKDSCNEKV